MCVRNLPGNHLQLRSLRRNKLNERRKRSDQEQENQRARDIESTVRNRRTLGVPALPDGCKQRRNRCADVIAEEDRYRAGKADDRVNAVRACLRRESLQNSDRGRTRLHDQRHAEAEQHPEHRNMGDFPHQIRKNRTLRKRLHYGTHDLDAFKKKAEGEDDHADVFHLIFLADKVNQKADENDREDITADIKGDQLCRHCRADIRAEDDRDRLRQSHQAGADKTDDHDRCCGARLQNRGDKRACESAHNRVHGQYAEDLFHSLARSLLQRLAHRIHAENKDRKAAEKAEQRRKYLVHILSFHCILMLKESKIPR